MDTQGTPEVDREELFQLLVESATDFAILTFDLRGIVTSWNIGCERVTGYLEEEIMGQSGDQIFVQEDRDAGAPEKERALALRDGRAEDERWHRRKDGSVFWGSGLTMPLRDGRGFVKLMRDRTQGHLAERQLAESEERFRTLATNIPQLVFRTRASGARSWGSPQWEVFTGLSDADSREFGWLGAIHPDDRAFTVEAWGKAREQGSYAVEHRIRRQSDGEYRWHQTRATPVPDSDNLDSEWVGTSTDIHELRGLQCRQQVLLAELQHRTRNLLALVQAMVRRTARSAASLAEFTTEFESRLAALSRVQGLVASTKKTTIPLRALIEAELGAHSGGAQHRISIAGPDANIASTAAQTLALALHELATNAVKYGAIGQEAGRLTVEWRLEEEAERPPRIVLDWRESGVEMPGDVLARRKGYGRELIERALPYQLGADTRLEFGPDGVHCMIAVEVSADEGGETA